MTPDCIAYLYKIPWATQSNITNSLGMYESLGEVHAQEDLDKFFELVAPYIPKGTGPQLDLINGATAPNPVEKSGGEAVLDFDMVYPIIYPQKSTLFQVKNDGLLDIFDAYLAAIDSEYCDQNNGHQMCGTYEPTNVISISYGGPEDPSNPKQAHVSFLFHNIRTYVHIFIIYHHFPLTSIGKFSPVSSVNVMNS